LSLEATLMIIGLNQRTAPAAVRERFWMSDDRRYEAQLELSQAEGIEEVIVLVTGNRTEFLLWAGDPSCAANSVLRLLTAQYGLKISEWEHFYRLLDDAAVLHIFRVATGLDSMAIGEPEVAQQMEAAWQQAQQAGTAGRCLDAVVRKALAVAQRVARETAMGAFTQPVPRAAVELACGIFGSLQNKQVLVLGSGKVSELAARALLESGAAALCVIARSLEQAQQLAATLAGEAAPLEDRWQQMLKADIVISSSGCPHTILTRDEAEAIVSQRKQRPLVLVDIAMPRDIDPAVRQLRGVHLYDIDDLQKITKHNAAERQAAAADAQRIVAAEVQGFRRQVLAERVIPTMVALRQRLDEICRQELDSYRKECGPFSKDQDAVLLAVTSRLTQRIAGLLARELREVPEKTQQEQMTAAVLRLFQLESPKSALADANLAKAN
jgi:glutamyl-tRNA reductase